VGSCKDELGWLQVSQSGSRDAEIDSTKSCSLFFSCLSRIPFPCLLSDSAQDGEAFVPTDLSNATTQMAFLSCQGECVQGSMYYKTRGSVLIRDGCSVVIALYSTLIFATSFSFC
jgi:hypothetical protein